jgi:hypothetical protein
MRDRILLPFCRGVMAAMLLAAVVLPADAADLDARTVEAYERYVAAVEATFVGQLDGDAFLTAETPSTGTGTLKRDTVRVRPGAGDGILDVHDGLIHHWRGTVFIPNATLERVLAVAQDFPAYSDIYPWILGTRVFDRAAAITKAECVRQVENAGERDEHLLPPGTGSGHLWGATMLARYLIWD